MSNKSHWIKREIPADQLQDIQITMNGQENCSMSVVKINGIEFGNVNDKSHGHGNGIAGFYLELEGGKKPKVTVHYHPHLATKEACAVLGIEKRPSYQKGN